MQGPAYPALVLDWSRSLYELETFPYKPREHGQAKLVKGEMTPQDGLVVVPSKDRALRAFDARTGKTLWERETLGPNVAPVVAVDEDLLVASLDGHLYRMHQRNGRVVWDSGSLGKGALYAPPVSDGERVFVTSDDDRIMALSLRDGTRLWERERAPLSSNSVVSRITGQAGAALHGEQVFTGFSDGHVMAFDVRDGATLWSRDLSGGGREFVDVDSTPIVTSAGLVVASAYATGLFALDAKGGEVVWKIDGRGFGHAAFHEGVLYVPRTKEPSSNVVPGTPNQSSMVAVDAATGKVLWTLRIGDSTPSRPAVSSKYLIVPTHTALLVVDRGTGRAIRQYDDHYGFSATPEVAWGTVYALANSGIMYAFGLY